MNLVKAELVSFNSPTELKTLLSAQGLCVSVYLPLSTNTKAGTNRNAKENELHWRECLRTLDNKTTQFGAAGRELVESLYGWDLIGESAESGMAQRKSLAVFRSSNLLQVSLLDRPVAQRAVLGSRFYIRPLLGELVRFRNFYLLALSQKNTRLLRCTTHTSEEISFPPGLNTDFEKWMNQVKPDHNAVYNAMTGSAQISGSPSALAPKGADQDSKDQYLSHYFKQIDRGVNETLKGKTEPVVLCGVEHEISLYREINRYPHLASEEVLGAPNSLKAGEMHARAIEALERCYAAKVERTIADWNHRVGAGASSRLADILTAVREGRVLTLLVSDSQEQGGLFDEERSPVNTPGAARTVEEDLVNEAAVEAILHAGNILVVPHRRMPNGSALAAIFRY